MIDVQPYIDKLELLKKYLSESIDGRLGFIWIDQEALPKMRLEEIMHLWDCTGILLFRSGEENTNHSVGNFSFEGWLEDYREKQELTNN